MGHAEGIGHCVRFPFAQPLQGRGVHADGLHAALAAQGVRPQVVQDLQVKSAQILPLLQHRDAPGLVELGRIGLQDRAAVTHLQQHPVPQRFGRALHTVPEDAHFIGGEGKHVAPRLSGHDEAAVLRRVHQAHLFDGRPVRLRGLRRLLRPGAGRQPGRSAASSRGSKTLCLISVASSPLLDGAASPKVPYSPKSAWTA